MKTPLLADLADIHLKDQRRSKPLLSTLWKINREMTLKRAVELHPAEYVPLAAPDCVTYIPHGSDVCSAFHCQTARCFLDKSCLFNISSYNLGRIRVDLYSAAAVAYAYIDTVFITFFL